MGGGATTWGTDTAAKAETSTAWGNNSIVHGGTWIEGKATYSDVEVLRNTTKEDGKQYYIQGVNDDTGNTEIIKEEIATRIDADNLIRTNGRLAGYNSTAFGEYSETYAENSLAALGGTVGIDDSNSGMNSAAIGYGSQVRPNNAYAIGNGATVGEGSSGSVALGGNGILKYGVNTYTNIVIRKNKDNTYDVIGIRDNGTEVTLNTALGSRDAALADIRAKNPDYTSVGTGATNAFAAVGGKVGNGALQAISIGSGSVIGERAENSVAVGARNIVTGVNSTAIGAGEGDPAADGKNYANMVTADASAALGNKNKIGKQEFKEVEIEVEINGSKINIKKNVLQADPTTTDVFVVGGNNEIAKDNGNATSIGVFGSTNKIEGEGLSTKSTIIGNINEVTDKLTNSLVAGNSNKGLNQVDNSQIIGNDNKKIGVDVSNLVVLGNDTTATGGISSAIAIGQGTTIGANNAIAMGSSSKAQSESSIAIGDAAQTAADKANATAIGKGANAKEADSVAFGSSSVADRGSATTAGYDVITNRAYAGFGSDSPTWKSTLASVSVGDVANDKTRQITSVAAGYEDTDAVNVAQLKVASALETDNRNVGLIINADGRREITSPYIHVEGVEDATAAFDTALAAYLESAEYTSATDKPAALAAKIEELKETHHFASATGDNAIAIGKDSVANKENALAFGTKQEIDAKNSGAFGNSSYVSGENSYSVGNDNNIYSNNTVALGNNITTGSGSNYTVAIGDQVVVDTNVPNATVIGYHASASVADSVALGSYSVASRGTDGDAGYDFNTGKASTDTINNAWRPTHAAISIGNDSTVTRQITGVAAGTADTDAVNVAQLKKAVWNVGIDENGGKVSRPEGESSLKVSETVVGNGKNKVQFVAGKGITLTSKDYTTDTAKDTYGIVISTRLEDITKTSDNKLTGIVYDGIPYTIASESSSGPANVTTDHRAVNVDPITLVEKIDGKDVEVKYRAINSPYLHINGLQEDPANPYAGGVAVAPEYQANAAGTYAIAMGREADALQTNSIAIGHMAEAGRSDIAAVNSVALGYRAHALANNSVSVGTAAFATGNRSIAIGVSNVVDTETTEHNDERAWAAGQGSMVLGNEATAVTQAVRFNLNNTGNSPIDYNTNDAIALGTRSDARALNAIALGGNMSYTIKDGERKGEVVYGAPEGNARNFGATVGEGARSAIAIGGAYGDFDENGNIQLSADGKTIKAQYAAATSYGAKGIAIGSGALIANNEDYLDLQKLIDNKEYQGRKETYYNARHAFTVAERAYNTYVASNTVPTPDPDNPNDPLYNDPIYKEYKRLKDNLDGTRAAYETATTAFSDDIREKIALEEKNASSVEDAVAIGAGSRTGVAGGIALGSQAKVGYLDRSGTESAMTGYDMQTGTGYYGMEANDPTWKATRAALSIGTLSTSDATDHDTNITRRITNVAAGVFDRDAVNVAQLKRATTFTTDYRNVAIGIDANSDRKIQSPYAHFEGVREVSDALSITEYGKQDYIDKVSAERDNIQDKIDEYKNAITELDKRLNGDTTTEGIVAKMNSVSESNPTLKAEYQKLINDINYEKTILTEKITDLTNELNLLPTDAGTAYDNAEALVKTQAKAYGKESIAFGKGSVVGEVDNDGKAIEGKGDQSIALGVNNTVTGNNSIAVGTGHKIYGKNSGAFGDPTEIDASVDGSYAIGNSSHITTSDTFILGNNVTTTFKDSVFLGTKSGYTEAGDTTAGINGYGTKDAPVEINGKPYQFAGATPAGVVSVGNNTDNGTRRIQNVAAGLISADSTDAINGSQLYQAMQALSVQVIGDTDTETKSTKVNTNPEPTTTGGSATGGSATGGDTTGGTAGGTTGGTSHEITLTPTVYEVKASTTTAKAGSDNIIVDEVIEPADPKSYKYTIDLAKNIDLGKDGSVTTGDTVMNNDGLTVGDTTVARDRVKVGDTNVNSDGVTIAGGPMVTKTKVDAAGNKITNVGSGLGNTYSNATDNNAANIGDVKELTTQVTVNDNGAAENKNLELTTTTTENGRNIYDVKLSNNVDLTAGGSLSVGDTKLNNDGVTIAGGPSMTKAGIDAAGNKITNVQAGTDPTDAVNVSQLRDFAAQTNQNITNVDSRARKGVAGAAALAALHPLDFDPDDKLTFAAGVGNYRGETAAAIGAFYRPDEKVMFSIGGSMGNGENVVNAGVSFSLDRTPRVTGSRTALTKEVVQLREQVARQDARLARQDAQIEKLTALVMKLAGNEGMEALSDTVGTAVPMKAPALFPDNLDNKWAYDFLEDLEQRGYIHGYAGRSLTRDEFAAALDRAMAGGAKLDERLIKEFEPELSHVRVVHIEGKGEDEGKSYERPRASHDKLEDKHEIEKKHFRVKEKKVTSKS
ncbi:MAG: YadA-like family protein [Acidaminococcaceae bacterium]|nr:YadA-like family protein [Acidaminococcaceae bacterium]